MKHNTNKPLITWRLAIFLLAMAFAEASRTMTMVQIPVYLRELGAEIRQIGLFFTISLIFPLILQTIGGWLSDSIGRLSAIFIGSLTGVLTYFAYAIAPSWQIALLGPTLQAITTALIYPSYKAYIADHTEEATRGRVFGISETVVTVAWIIGPPIGGFIGQISSYQLMFAAAAFTFSIAAVIFLMLAITGLKSTVEGAKRVTFASLRSSFGKMFLLMVSGGLVTWILITDGVRDVAFRMSFDLMPVYLSDIAGISKQGIGLLDGIFGISLALTSIPAGILVDKTTERLGIVLGLCAVISSRLSFALASEYWDFAFSWILLGIGAGLMEPAYNSLISKGVSQQLRGITYGLLTTSLGIISLPSPWIGSLLWAWLGPQYPFLITAVLGCFALLPAWSKLIVSPYTVMD